MSHQAIKRDPSYVIQLRRLLVELRYSETSQLQCPKDLIERYLPPSNKAIYQDVLNKVPVERQEYYELNAVLRAILRGEMQAECESLSVEAATQDTDTEE